MAPRRGGGGGYSSSSSSNDSIWLEETDIGWWLSRDNGIALIVFYGIFLVALIGTFVWASIFKWKHKATEVVRGTLGNSWWALALFFGIIYYAFSFADAILRQNETSVKRLYLIIFTILITTGYIAEICLLFTIYVFLSQCSTGPNPPEDTKSGHKQAIFRARLIWCAILVALYVAMLALRIRDTVRLDYDFEGVPVATKILVAYRTLLMVASIDVLVATILLNVNASKGNLSQALRLGLVGLIGFPFLFYATIGLAYVVRYSYQQYLQSDSAGLAGEFVEGITFVSVYTGLVFACQQSAKAAWAPWQGPHQTGQGPMPQQGAPVMSPHPSQHYGPQYGLPSPQYGVPSQQYGYPPQQYGAPPQQYGAPQQFGHQSKPHNLGAQQAHEIASPHP